MARHRLAGEPTHVGHLKALRRAHAYGSFAACGATSAEYASLASDVPGISRMSASARRSRSTRGFARFSGAQPDASRLAQAAWNPPRCARAAASTQACVSPGGRVTTVSVAV
jgi:hypothetical protein